MIPSRFFIPNKASLTLPIFMCCAMLSLISCVQDDIDRHFPLGEVEGYRPIYASQVNLDIELQTAREIVNPGQIVGSNELLFIIEELEGIHIIDNSDSSNPIKKGFLKAEGSSTIAISENTLFVDQFGDLLSIDISDPDNPVLVHRETTSLKIPAISFHPPEFWAYFECIDPAKGQVVGWELTTIMDPQCLSENTRGDYRGTAIADRSPLRASNHFEVVNDYLYATSLAHLISFEILGSSEPVWRSTISNTFRFATSNIVAFESEANNLILGTDEGVFFMNIDDPALPVRIGVYPDRFYFGNCNAQGLTKDELLFIISSSSGCNAFLNDQLEIMNISDYDNPESLFIDSITSPYDLVLKENFLFVCESAGISVLDYSDPTAPVWKDKYVFDSDEIPINIDRQDNLLIVQTNKGIYNMTHDQAGELRIDGIIETN